MKIGYLHINPPHHGICRYGRLLALEAQQRQDLKVIQASITLTNNLWQNRSVLTKAAQYLSDAEIVHIQYSRVIWGQGWFKVYNLYWFIRHSNSPIILTIHDVFPRELYIFYGTKWERLYRYMFPEVLPENKDINPSVNKQSFSEQEAFLQYIHYPLFFIKHRLKFLLRILLRIIPNNLTIRWLSGQVEIVVLCTEEEKRRLGKLVDAKKIAVIPHFVKEIVANKTPELARKKLGLENIKTVTLLGFISPYKGHQLVVEALPYLPPDVQVIFAGGSGIGESNKFVNELLELAKVKKLDHRLRVTGYLDDEELTHYMLATDLAICPFYDISASGSLSTWISAARPILTSNIPQISEYNRLQPDAIKIFHPYTPIALAEAIRQLLPLCKEGKSPVVAGLRQQLLVKVILDKHLFYYRCAVEASLPSDLINI